jgi:transcriptional regulator with XRE-family HTH domain
MQQTARYGVVFGQVLATRRQIPQAKLAALLGVAQNVVSRTETGKVPLQLERFIQWVKALDVSAVDVLRAVSGAVGALEAHNVQVVYWSATEPAPSGMVFLSAQEVYALIKLWAPKSFRTT